ncbi:uncharacterized protein AAG666_015045 isoform 2-T5 [Megaptera novaeangliae]
MNERAREEVGVVPTSQPFCRDQKGEWWVQSSKQTRYLPHILFTRTAPKLKQQGKLRRKESIPTAMITFIFKSWTIRAILILKMEEKSNIFGILCFLIPRKVKTQLKRKKRFMQCMEKVL